MRYDAVLFDLDGTLLNTIEDLTDSCNAAMDEMGYPRHSVAAVTSFVNNGARALIARACPEGTSEADEARCLTIFQAHYRGNLDHKTRPYDGIAALLTELHARGVKNGVVSNKFDGAVKPICQKYFGALIDAAVGERPGVSKKPAPDSVFAALGALGVPADRALYVGDTGVDIETARNAGLPCISVTWGYRPREELIAAGATRLADDAAALLRLILLGDTAT